MIDKRTPAEKLRDKADDVSALLHMPCKPAPQRLREVPCDNFRLIELEAKP